MRQVDFYVFHVFSKTAWTSTDLENFSMHGSAHIIITPDKIKDTSTYLTLRFPAMDLVSQFETILHNGQHF